MAPSIRVQLFNSKALLTLLGLALLATCCNLWNLQETEAVHINIYKHRYPFYGGYGYYPFWGGYGGGHGGYGGISIGGGGYGRRR